MMNLLHPGEKLGEIIYNVPDYTVVDIVTADHRPGDCVALRVRNETEPVVWLGDNSLNVRVISGFGRMSPMDVGTGEFTEKFLEPGSEVKIKKDTAYFYRNLDDDQGYTLTMRDETIGFDSALEPTVAEYFGTE